MHTFMHTQKDKTQVAGLRFCWDTRCGLLGDILVSYSVVLRGSCHAAGAIRTGILRCFNDRTLLTAGLLVIGVWTRMVRWLALLLSGF